MQTICEYRILSAALIADLVADVNECIEAGWQPIGGAFEYHRPPGFNIICQAMVRTEDREDDRIWFKRLAETAINEAKRGEQDKASLLGLHSAITFLGGIWTYPDRDPENQNLYEACRELESMGKLASTEHPNEPFDMICFKPALEE